MPLRTSIRDVLDTGSSGITTPGTRMGFVIEDPIFRVSRDSMFIHAADVVAFTLKEKEFAQGSRKKFNADRIFARKLGEICVKSAIADQEGIIRLE
jgi:hypothetical protein